MVPFYRPRRNRVEHIWSFEETLQLLRDVRANRILWDVNAERGYGLRNNTWRKIAEAFSTSANDCKGKFSNLKTTYAMNIEKYRRQKEAGVDEPVILWKFFKVMQFLDKNNATNSTVPSPTAELVSIWVSRAP